MIKADLILKNGKIWSGERNKPFVNSLAIWKDRIIHAGDEKDAECFSDKKTEIIDLRGNVALPGFTDCHTHFVLGSLFMKNLDLRNSKSKKAFIDKIREKKKEYSPQQWICGGNWDNQKWDDKSFPSKELLDEFTPDNPVLLYRIDLHTALVNSYLLKRAGITKDTPDPDGGEIERNPETGEPTGILKEAAVEIAEKIMPSTFLSEAKAAVKEAITMAHRNGVTGIHDISSYNDIKVYHQLIRERDLFFRVFCRTPISGWEDLSKIGIQAGYGNEFLRLGSVKGFIDGALGSNTAYFFEPYIDQPQNYGLLNAMVIPENKFIEMVKGADNAGLTLSIHAIGDKANHMLLNIYEKLPSGKERRERRHRIEHAQHVIEEDIERFKRLNVIVSAQPYHLADDGMWTEEKIGSRRCRFSYPFRSFLDNDVRLVFGSDWPVTPLEPLKGIFAAVTRETNDGKNPGGWFPEQKIPLDEALYAYTRNAAYASFEENIKGTLADGKLADVIVLSDDIFSVAPSKIQNIRVIMTVFGGSVVYSE